MFVALSLLALGMVLLLGAVTPVHAASEPAYCVTIGGYWDGVSTCTFTGTYFDHTGTLEITSGTLVLSASDSTFPPICGFDQILFESTGSLKVDSGATVDIQTSSSGGCFGITTGIDLDGNGTGIVNYGIINVDPAFACDGVSVGLCGGILNDRGNITNYGTISIGGTYNCGAGWICVGIYNRIGTLTDVNCGTTSPTVTPYVMGNAVTSSGTCTKQAPSLAATGAEICQHQASGQCFTSFIAFDVTSGGTEVDANVTIVTTHGPTQIGTTEVGSPLQTAWYGVSILDTVSYTVTLPSGNTLTGTVSNPNPWTVMVVNVSG